VENNSEDKGNADLTKKVDVTGDQFTFYTRQDDCFYESCKFRNNTHYHCAQVIKFYDLELLCSILVGLYRDVLKYRIVKHDDVKYI